MAFKDAVQDHQTDDVLNGANDAEKVIHLVTAMRHVDTAITRREYGEANRESEGGSTIPERIVVGMIVVLVNRTARHHHADHLHLFGATEIFNRAIDT